MSDLMDRARGWLSGLFVAAPLEPATPGEPTALCGLDVTYAIEHAIGAATYDQGSARDRTSSAIGGALSGLRTAVFLSGPELAEVHKLIAWAAGRSAPMVVHASLRAGPGHAIATGTGHEGWHAIADAGCVQLMAGSVQEAADLTLVARRVAETALVPVVIGIDDEQIARSVQDLRLLSDAQMRAIVGERNDMVPCSESEKMVFGDQRRRVPIWHDLERPALHGAPQGGTAWSRGAASREVYVHDEVGPTLQAAVDDLEVMVGRSLQPVEPFKISDAQLVIIAQGSLAQTAVAVAEDLRAKRSVKVGVITLRSLRPFPSERLANLLVRPRRVVVLERVSAPLGADPPLLRALRGTVTCPAWHGVTVGSGGHAVRAADLGGLCERLAEGGPTRLYLGIDFAPALSPYPRHQAHLDHVRRTFADRAGVGHPAEAGDYTHDDAVVIGISGPVSDSGLVDRLARLLHATLGGHVRTRPICSERAGWVAHSHTALPDVGDVVCVDALILMPGLGDRRAETLPPLRNNAWTLLIGAGDPWSQLPARTTDLLRDAEVNLLQSEHRDDEHVLTAMMSVLRETGVEVDEAKFAAAWTTLNPSFDAPTLFISPTALNRLSAPAASRTMLEPEAPLALRHLGRDGGPRGVPSFWANVGVHFRDGYPERVVPDPSLAIGAVPPLTASFCDLSGTRVQLPVFEPASCTGCGDCWVACPEGALGAVAIGPKSLIEAGMKLAGGEELRQVVGKIARAANKAIANGTGDGTAEQIFAPVMDRVIAGADVARQGAMTEARDRVLSALAPLCMSRTEPFFDQAEAAERNAGELLAIVVDPAACTGCSSCTRSCRFGALTAEPQTHERVAQARKAWHLWEQLPDTSGATLARIRELPEPGPLASVMLARSSLLGLHGGNHAERGSGGKLALRAVLGMVEAARQPAMVAYLARIRDLSARVAKTIRDELVQALPTSDLDALATGLAAEGPAVDLHRLVQRIDDAHGKSSTLDTLHSARLRRLTLLARGLSELGDRIEGTVTGLPRARVGAVLHPALAAAWGVRYPYNPFQVPVVVAATDDLVPLANGLLQGQLGEFVGDLALLLRANEELKTSRVGERPSLQWSNLDSTDRATCAPMLVVGTDALLWEPALREAIAGGLPIKVLVLSDLDLSRPGQELDLVALGHRGAYAVQTSLAAPGHFTKNVLDALQFEGPAVLRVHAPSPERHGFPVGAAMDRARGAVSSGAWPLFAFDPRLEGVLGTCLVLDDRRPAGVTASSWAMDEARYDAARPSDRERQATWSTLQELSGAVTPFTETVRTEITAEVRDKHLDEVATVRAEAQAQLADLHGAARAAAADRLHQRLMALAGMHGESR